MASRGVDRRVIALAVGVPVMMLVAFAAGRRSPTTRSTPTTVASDPPASTAPLAVDEAWNEALEEVIGPLGDVIPRLSDAVTSWGSGELGDAELAAVLDDVDPLLSGVRSATADLPPHPGDELAAPLVRRMARLYVLAVDAHRLAVRSDDRAVATQYDRLGRRLRVLGDRVFDRARERTAVAFDPGAGVDLRLPAEVPDWTRLGMAVGPPLEPTDTNVDDLPRQREDERPSQPTPAWRSAVDDLGAPAVTRVRRAVDAGDVEELGRAARALVSAAEALRSVPVPEGDRGRADRLALAWLVRADAARAGQLAALSGDARDATVLATELLDVSEGAPLG